MPFPLWTGATGLDVFFGTIFLLLLIRMAIRIRPISKGLRLPPGPKGKPVVGNLADMPTHHEWETFTQWGKEYGGLVYIKVFGQSIIVVNSAEVARDLFERRSSIYSDRFHFPMLNDLMGLSWNFPLMKYGNNWRKHRKAFQQHFNPTAVTAYNEVQTKHTRALLRNFYKSPEDFVGHLRHLAGAIVMEVVYGIQVQSTEDPYIEMAEKALAAVGEAGNPGTYLVDTLPILKYVPEWLPGAGFQRKARLWRAIITDIRELPFMVVKKDLSAGTARPSVTASLLEKLFNRTDAPEDEEDLIRNISGAAYGAASDTTVSALSSFILAMLLYPEVQLKAQAELDYVIGMSRLPVFEDRDKLPYINALCKEIYRWHPVAPLGIAHRVTQDDVYGDHFIPGGSIVFGNSWAILHDEKIYGPEPEHFIPERFLKPGVEEPTPAFGFGRRICAGRHMADHAVFIAVALTLFCFDISPAQDSQGNEVPVKGSFTSGLISYPEPFRCAIKPRSPSTESLLMECADD